MTDAEMLQRVSDVIAAATGMTRAPQIFVAEANPSPDLQSADGASKFSISWPSTANTGQYRDDVEIRQRHRIEVGFVRRMKMTDQFQAMIDAAGVEEEIKAALGRQARMSPLRANYVDTARRLSPAREHLIVYVRFDIIHDFFRTG